MSCERCKNEKWPPEGASKDSAPRRCAFVGGKFQSDNWNCGTMNALRGLLEMEDTHYSDDQSLGVLSHDGRFIILGWYKSRGRTELARFVDEGLTKNLTLRVAERFIKELS